MPPKFGTSGLRGLVTELTPALLESAYGHPMEVLTDPVGGRRIVLPARVPR